MRQILFKFLFLGLILTAGVFSNAQCPSGDVNFNSQSDVDNFIIQYPNCTEIEGILWIGSNNQNDIDDLSPLQNLTKAGTVVVRNTSLINLEGLNNLENCSGSFEISSNPSLTNLIGLDNLSSTLHFFVQNNPALSNLEGLEALTSIGGTLSIVLNPNLVNLQGLENLETISEQNSIGELYISTNNSLISIDALNKLNKIGGQLYIKQNPLLENLSGLENLTFIGGTLRLDDLQSLNSIEALGNLNTLNIYGGYLQLNMLPSLINLHGLENITQVGALFIEYCDALQNLEGLNGITNTSVELSSGDFRITSNASLTSLNGLNSYSKTHRDTYISNNPALTSLGGLSNFHESGCSLIIHNNSLLTNLSGLDNLTTMVTTCNLAGLSISNNPQLANVDALENLSNIPYPNLYMDIQNNPMLESLSGLENIPSDMIYYLKLQSSQDLATCNLPNICEYLSNGGDNEISGNATGCDSSEEILELCALSIEEISDAEEITLYPVPTKQILNVSAKNNAAIEQINVYDLTGKLVFTSKGNQSKIDVSHLDNGTYLVSVKTSKRVHTEKILKE